MSSPSRIRAVWVAGLVILALGGALEAGTLTLEEVVRLHVSGVDPDDLIARIHASEVDFDLSEPMLEELRAAELPEAVIAAMIERQTELHPPPPPAPSSEDEAEVAPARTGLVLHARDTSGSRAGPVELRAASRPSPELRQQLSIADETASIDDLALYVACVSATHVPDHWRTESPLGRDFEGAPRHRMLHFLSGAARDEAGPGASTLRLSIPETIEVTLDPGDAHQLVIGVAIRLAGRYVTTSLSSVHALETAGTAPELGVSIVQRGSDPRAIRITVERPSVSQLE